MSIKRFDFVIEDNDFSTILKITDNGWWWNTIQISNPKYAVPYMMKQLKKYQKEQYKLKMEEQEKWKDD